MKAISTLIISFNAMLLLLFTANTYAFQTKATTPSFFALGPRRQRQTAAQRNDSTKQQQRTRDTSCQAFDSATSAIATFYQSQPYISAFLTCSVKASAADWAAQSRQAESVDDNDRQHQMDMSRNLAFLLYGGMYQGLGQQFMYSEVFPGLFGTESSWQTVAMTVSFDMLLVGPFLCLPMAYLVKSMFVSKEISTEAVQAELEKYWEDVTERGLLFKYWSLWVPVQSLNFGIVPRHFRCAFVAAVSFFWVLILSSVSASKETDSSEQSSSKS